MFILRAFLSFALLSAILASCGKPNPSVEDAAGSTAVTPPQADAAPPPSAATSQASLPKTGSTQEAITSVEAPQAPASACQLDGSKLREISVVDLARALQTPALRRRQSESSEEFELRAEKALAEIKRMTGGDLFNFTVPVPPAQVVVDATAGVLTVHPANISGGLVPTTIGNGNRVIIAQSARNLGTTSSEAGLFGRYVATKEEQVILAVNVSGGDYLGWPKGFKAATFQWEHQTARRSKTKTPPPELAVLFRARLQSPYIAEETTLQRPRPDFPHDVTTVTTTVFVELECATLINRSKNTTLAHLFGP